MMMMTFITQGVEGRGSTSKKSKATKSKGGCLESGPVARLDRIMMMMTFITQGGEGQGKTNKKRKATNSKGRSLVEGASRALMRQVEEEGCGERG